MADEYISKEKALNLIEHNDRVLHYVAKIYEDIVYSTTQSMCEVIALMPAADVQPVPQWISVDERLPENFEDCLVWYRCDTAFGKSESWGIAACSRGEWYTKHLHGDNIVVLFWHSMPKPPKDGDTE